MIEDPPLLTMRRHFPRPAPEQVAAFANVPTGHAVDALGGRGALDYRIKPLEPPPSVIVGVAITCHCGPTDNLGLFGALAEAQPGDILVAATDQCTVTSIAGDLLMGMARNRGIKALLTDGLVRDVVGILGVGLPVFCAGVSPDSPARNGPGSVGMPVVLGGVSIDSGDIIVADRDGVVVVPRLRIAAVLKQLEQVRAAESALEAKVKDGLEVPDFVRQLLDSGRVVDADENGTNR
ncbi:MAG: RraA family protein [Hyphomicrobiales bacterium]